MFADLVESPEGRFLGKSFWKAAARTFVPLIVFSEKRSGLGVCLGDSLERLSTSLSSNSALRVDRHVMGGSYTPQGPSTRHWVVSSAMYLKLFPKRSRACRDG
jgi:hypothetical protein